MMSKKTLLIAVGLGVVLAFVGGYLLRNDEGDVDNSPSPSPTLRPTSSPTPTVSAPAAYTVRVAASGPAPKTLTIRTGDSVTFVNNGTAGYWPASDPHPTHDQCSGFDARRVLNQGDTYTLTFTERRTCAYHDHRNPGASTLRGTIIVQ